MKRIFILLLAAAIMITVAGCGSSSDSAAADTSETTQEVTETEEETDETEETPDAAEAEPTSEFEQQVFECDSVKITLTGMSVLTEGNNIGYVGADFLIEDKTDNTLTLPAFTEVYAGTMMMCNGYPMGKKAGDTVIWNKDHTGSFSHTWDIQDSSGNTVDTLSMQLTIPASLMDESVAAGTYYEKGDWSAEVVEIINDDWIRVTTGDDNTHINIVNQSGGTLYLQTDAKDDFPDLANGAEMTLENTMFMGGNEGWIYQFKLYDSKGVRRTINITVSLVNDEYEVSYEVFN